MSAELIRTIAKNNESFAHSHNPPLAFKDFPDMKAAIVVSCADPRANPNEFWKFGAEGPIIVRNAGGRVTEDTLRSIRVISGIMSYGRNTVGAVAVVQHTDCGLRNFSNEEVASLLKQRAGLEGQRAKEVEKMDFGSWKDAASPEESVKRDMKKIKNDPYLPKEIEVVGYVYDVFSGKTTEVH